MKRVILIFTGLFLFITAILDGQEESELATDVSMEAYKDLFELDEPLNLTMKFDIRAFRRTRSQEKYQPAEMSCFMNDTSRVIHPVRIKARGIYRRDNCSVPPFWLNIRHSGIENDELTGVRRMKMVTRCRSAKHYSDYLLREYLVYKIYSLLTPYSYRVRLVNLRLVNSRKEDKESVGWAFLIEPDEMMAARLHAKVIRSDEFSMRSVNRKVMDRLAMFQYMIGNADYSVTGRHNLKILKTDLPGSIGFLPVPYDFDYTGLVNANYALPVESLGISSVRERYFLGPCRSQTLYFDTILELEAVREEIRAVIWEFKYLNEAGKLDMIGYIESFFNMADNERFIEREISPTCR